MGTAKTFIIGFLFISLQILGQSSFTQIDNSSKRVPNSIQSYQEIAQYLTKDFTNDIEKSRALYIWISHNISYNVDLLNNLPKYTSQEAIIEEVMQNRNGVCQHYADLFLVMSNSIGLQTYTISGYSRNTDGEIAEISHAWNAIKIDSNYFLLDITWAAGHATEDVFYRKFNDNFFLKTPQEFIADHIPFDPVWQFLDNPIRHKDFSEQSFEKLNIPSDYPFKEILKSIDSLDAIAILKTSNSRIIRCGTSNQLIKNQIQNNLNSITSIEFNTAVDTLNFGIKNYNTYIDAKNNKFKNPKLNDEEIKSYISNAEIGIKTANEMMLNLTATDEELSFSLNHERNRLPKLIKTVETEKDFVDRYIKKWKPLRATMFYSFKANKINTSSKPVLF